MLGCHPSSPPHSTRNRSRVGSSANEDVSAFGVLSQAANYWSEQVVWYCSHLIWKSARVPFHPAAFCISARKTGTRPMSALSSAYGWINTEVNRPYYYQYQVVEPSQKTSLNFIWEISANSAGDTQFTMCVLSKTIWSHHAQCLGSRLGGLAKWNGSNTSFTYFQQVGGSGIYQSGWNHLQSWADRYVPAELSIVWFDLVLGSWALWSYNLRRRFPPKWNWNVNFQFWRSWYRSAIQEAFDQYEKNGIVRLGYRQRYLPAATADEWFKGIPHTFNLLDAAPLFQLLNSQRFRSKKSQNFVRKKLRKLTF